MILTIGAFDGFHRGHERLLRAAWEMGDPWGVVTFSPHPSVFLGSLKTTLFTLRDRELMRRVLGIPNLFILQFDQETRNLSPEEFWERLRRTFPDLSGLVMGRDFRFGRDQAGTAELLEALCRRDGVRSVAVDLLRQDGERLSSSEARRDILSGDVGRAAEVLGYPWFLWRRVRAGKQRGRRLGFPTANLALSRQGEQTLLPAPGVYAAILPIGGQWHCGALSLGDNPTFGDVEGIQAEVFVLDFDGDLYGVDLPVLLLERLRPMERFADAEALAARIAQDVLRCREAGQREITKRAEFLTTFARCLKEMNAEMDSEGPFEPRIWRLSC